MSNAFLNGHLKEEVYMHQSLGFVDAAYPNYVCKLHKSFYGLKQAPQAWFERFTFHLLHLGFTMADSCSFFNLTTPLFIYFSK